MSSGKPLTLLVSVAVLQLIVGSVDAAKILLVCPQMFSHVTMQLSVADQLVRRGHQVYLAVGSRYPRLTDIERHGVHPLTFHVPSDVLYGFSDDWEHVVASTVYSTTDRSLARWSFVFDVARIAYRDCELMLTDDVFIQQLRGLQFDMAVAEAFVLAPCPLAIPKVLGIPYVSMTSHYFPWAIRVPALPSFFSPPAAWRVGLHPSSFVDSIGNTVLFLLAQFLYVPLLHNETFRLRFVPDVPSWNSLIRQSELLLTDSSQYFDCALPLFPGVISTGGYTVGPAGPLPGDLTEVFDRANDVDGVIVVSFGTGKQHIPVEVVRKFLDAFSTLSQTIVAKFGVPDGLEVPPNVHLVSWMPQNDVLGHSYTRLFITHCGINGQYEALYHGVPMLGFPVFGDQAYNCHRAVEKGYGLEMDVRDFTAAELRDNIRELLDNATYRTTIQRASAAWRDEPLIGPQKAAFWIDHVIKHGGAHLRSPAIDLPLYRFLMLDVLFAGLLIITTAVCVSVYCIRLAIKRFKNSEEQLTVENNKSTVGTKTTKKRQ